MNPRKGTSYIILPFIVLACWWMSSRASRILFLKRAVVLVALVLAINGPQYLRNYEFGGLSLRDGRVHFMRYSPRPRCDLNPP
jgi:hypothetical protein